MVKQDQAERQVNLGEVPADQARSLLRAEADTVIADVADAVIQFTKVKDFTSFDAEYTYVNSDLVMHFFLPPEKRLSNQIDRQYWIEYFPKCLDEAARTYFNAEYPRLMAKYTEEMESWWFKANGFEHVVDPDALAVKFLKALDTLVDARRTTS
jgi:hypothetical protein